MAIVKMQKLSVIGMNDEKQSLLKELMDLGVVEITNGADKLQDEDWNKLVVKDGDEENVSVYEKKIAEADSARSVLEQYCKLKNALFGRRSPVSRSDYEAMVSNTDHFEAEALEVIGLNEQLQNAYAEENAGNALITSLNPWQSYELPLEETETARLRLRLGVLPPVADVAKISEELAGAGLACELESLDSDADQTYVSLWYFKEDEEKVMDIVKSSGYTNAGLGELTGTVKENIEAANAKIAELTQKKEELIAKIRDKADYKEDIEYFHDVCVVRRDSAKVRSKLLTTEETFTFDGWVPTAAVDSVGSMLDKYTCFYEVSEPAEDDDVPVRLKNSKFFTPIEFITNMYSLPNFHEVDPTSIYAFFYIIFFGIMFGDVGYGILLILGTGLILKKGKLYEGGAYKLMKVLFYSGFSSVFWGVMFGSIFGDMIPVVANTFFGKTVTINPLWLDPAKQPMIFLVFSCGIGVVHLFVGMAIDAYEKIRGGSFLEACKDDFAWYLIVLGIIMWIFGGRVSAGMPHVGKIMTLIGVAAAMILPIIVNKGVGKALGIWDLYSGITGNLSDILSYSRLLGLGLASTSIAQVFNFLASMAGKGVVGVIVFIVIALLGHTMNFAINALGAFVHSCRLQYVEFFGRFYEGGGRAFEPFRKDTKYINIFEEGK